MSEVIWGQVYAAVLTKYERTSGQAIAAAREHAAREADAAVERYMEGAIEETDES